MSDSPKNILLTETLRILLMAGQRSAPEISQALKVSPRTALSLTLQHKEKVCSFGNGKRRRYALRRQLRGSTSEIQVFTIDKKGVVSETNPLCLVYPSGCLWQANHSGYPVDEETKDGLWSGLPYPICDMYPEGFLGRAQAQREHKNLQVATNPKEWSDDDILHVLCRTGADTKGNLIVGEEALHLFHQELAGPADALSEAVLLESYVRYATQALRGTQPGSSAGGDFPKFTALRLLTGSKTPHVIVKFSGEVKNDDTARWADLLRCEQIALKTLHTTLGIPAASSRILEHQGRVFLESERFDRHGHFGRSPLISFFVLSNHFGLPSTNWCDNALQLEHAKLFSSSNVEQVKLTWWFGILIANTDMHLGNISVTLTDKKNSTKGNKVSPLTLAPIYDMLPMAYAPYSGGEPPPLELQALALPKPADTSIWKQASVGASEFWKQVTEQKSITDGFRRLADQYLERISVISSRI
jgi:hypothetical protein